MGPDGWRRDLIDDRSPEGHLTGYIVLSYIYGRGQSTAGLRVAEGVGLTAGGSQQDYDLGLIGISLGSDLAESGFAGGQMIRDLAAATAGTWSRDTAPAGIAASYNEPTSLRGNLWCYFGLSC